MHRYGPVWTGMDRYGPEWTGMPTLEAAQPGMPTLEAAQPGMPTLEAATMHTSCIAAGYHPLLDCGRPCQQAHHLHDPRIQLAE
eukprot:365925-Chlamydomonas_euryale.AAC.14